MNRETTAAIALTAFAIITTAPGSYSAENDLAEIKAEVTKRHDEAVKRLADWNQAGVDRGGESRVQQVN